MLLKELDVVCRTAALVLAAKLRMAEGGDLDERKALLLMFDRLLEYLFAHHGVRYRGARHKGRARAGGELADVDVGSIDP